MPYFSELGVQAIWLSPIYKSPMKDFGYDISDFKDVDPTFGTLEDFKSLVSSAHDRGTQFNHLKLLKLSYIIIILIILIPFNSITNYTEKCFLSPSDLNLIFLGPHSCTDLLSRLGLGNQVGSTTDHL